MKTRQRSLIITTWTTNVRRPGTRALSHLSPGQSHEARPGLGPRDHVRLQLRGPPAPAPAPEPWRYARPGVSSVAGPLLPLHRLASSEATWCPRSELEGTIRRLQVTAACSSLRPCVNCSTACRLLAMDSHTLALSSAQRLWRRGHPWWRYRLLLDSGAYDPEPPGEHAPTAFALTSPGPSIPLCLRSAPPRMKRWLQMQRNRVSSLTEEPFVSRNPETCRPQKRSYPQK